MGASSCPLWSVSNQIIVGIKQNILNWIMVGSGVLVILWWSWWLWWDHDGQPEHLEWGCQRQLCRWMLADRPLSTEFHLDQHHYKMHIEISQAMFCSQWDNIVFITDKKVNWEKLIFKPRRHFRLQGEDRWKVDWELAGSRGCWGRWRRWICMWWWRWQWQWC